ncbi:RNA polymerase sigma factor [Lignipirellula cremea]|uniref:RNA polymerase sigma factor SigK n=1 Tax=Lignipirellula cremea TaxID=2528010 RepID=A0A518DWE8_9BACT|nr:sigma-70 family RNA polymerase sigma factor [Lignipirellula cremea]QDU96154.1 RNA polymerase sigma factor SigK [Lignipirellula cremea]
MIDSQLSDLLRRIGEGDQQAAQELVQQFEPEIRRAVRVRLTDPRLRRVLDSVDVCQSVFANFFVRVAAGEFDLSQPSDLAAMLTVMARNKLLDQVRRLHAQKRDQRRVGAGSAALREVATSATGPDQLAEEKDLLSQVRRRLTPDERRLADLRAAGKDWAEIALELDALPDSLRKKLSRALDRVTKELGLEEL